MKSFPALLAATLLLGGCAGTPSDYLVLNPETPTVERQVSGRIALNTEDSRRSSDAVRFYKDDQPLKQLSTSEPPARQLGEMFRNSFAKAGFQLDPAATNTLELKLERLQSDISESLLGYQAKHEIIISAFARNEQQVFTKRYSAKGTMSGPLTLDLASLELELNQLITRLGNDIVNDPELNHFLMQ